MSETKPIPPEMSCAEFQEHLPELFAGPDGGLPKSDPSLELHLKTCANCAALVRDLQYIAEQARQLMEPAHDVDPSDQVWANIQNKLKEDPGPEA